MSGEGDFELDQPQPARDRRFEMFRWHRATSLDRRLGDLESPAVEEVVDLVQAVALLGIVREEPFERGDRDRPVVHRESIGLEEALLAGEQEPALPRLGVGELLAEELGGFDHVIEPGQFLLGDEGRPQDVEDRVAGEGGEREGQAESDRQPVRQPPGKGELQAGPQAVHRHRPPGPGRSPGVPNVGRASERVIVAPEGASRGPAVDVPRRWRTSAPLISSSYFVSGCYVLVSRAGADASGRAGGGAWAAPGIRSLEVGGAGD